MDFIVDEEGIDEKDENVVVCLGREEQLLSVDLCCENEPKTIEQVREMYRKFKEFKEESYVVLDPDDNEFKKYVRVCGRAIQFNDSFFNRLLEIPDPYNEIPVMIKAFFDAIQCCIIPEYKQRMLHTPISQWKPIVEDAWNNPLIFTRIGYDNGSEDTNPEVAHKYLTFMHKDQLHTPKSIYERVKVELLEYYLILMKQCILEHQAQEQKEGEGVKIPRKRGRPKKIVS